MRRGIAYRGFGKARECNLHKPSDNWFD
jgi:hypothetical protein